MIRPAQKQDIEGIEKLLNQVLLVHHEGRPDLFKERGAKYSPLELEDIINNEHTPVFVYEEQGRILAHCFCRVTKTEETGAVYAHKTLFIDDLCVDESARGRHIGKAMYEFVKTFALTQGFYNITLHVWECNPKAFAFYKSLGMEIQQYTMEEVLENGD